MEDAAEERAGGVDNCGSPPDILCSSTIGCEILESNEETLSPSGTRSFCRH
jgi:uncharacterized OsmC-like protein